MRIESKSSNLKSFSKCEITRVDETIYKVNIEFLLRKLDEVQESDPIDTKSALLAINQLYYFMLNSGFLNAIYMEMFIKLKGMRVLRSFQNFIFGNKDLLTPVDYDELKYLVSLLVLTLYKHFKTHDEIEINNNPFVEFNEGKIDGYQEFANISLQMDTDFIDENDLQGRNALPGLL